MRAHDGSRLRADHPNKLTALDLVKVLLDRGADPNKPFVGQMHTTTLCCDPEHQRLAVLSRRDRVRRRGAEADARARRARSSGVRAEVKKEGKGGARGGGGGRGQRQRRQDAGDGRDDRRPRRAVRRRSRVRPPRSAAVPRGRRIASRLDAVKVLLAAGAESERQGAGRLDAAAPGGARRDRWRSSARWSRPGAKLDAVNKDNLTPLLLAEKPEPPPPPGNNNDPRHVQAASAIRARRSSRPLRELMHLGPERSGARAAAAARSDDKKKATRRRRTTKTRRPTNRPTQEDDCEQVPTLDLWPAAAVLLAQSRERHAQRSPAPRRRSATAAPRRRRRRPSQRRTAGAQRRRGGRGCEISRLAESRTASAVTTAARSQPAERSGEPRVGQPRRPAAAGRNLGARAPQAERARDAAARACRTRPKPSTSASRRWLAGSLDRAWAGHAARRAATWCIG